MLRACLALLVLASVAMATQDFEGLTVLRGEVRYCAQDWEEKVLKRSRTGRGAATPRRAARSGVARR